MRTPLVDNAALARLAEVGRMPLGRFPTPLLESSALAAHLKTPVRISVKADDWTGFGLGGNKVRKLEYELDPVRLAGVTDLVTAGGPQSNHCRVVAAAAAHLSLGCTLVVNGRPKDERRGNARLHRLLGARIVTVANRAEREPAMEEEARRIKSKGGKALLIPLGASTARGALGYVHAMVELHRQLAGAPVWIFAASSSGGTMAGLVLGCAILGWFPRLVAVSVDEKASHIKETVTGLAGAAAEVLSSGEEASDLPERTRNAAASVLATDAFVGAGYGLPTPRSEEAAALFGAGAGVVLDPVYTAKAAAAMISWIREGRTGNVPRTVFLHTGGHPSLFR